MFPGTLPAIFIMEAIMQHVGEALGVPPENVKEKNLYEKGQVKKLKYYAMVLHPYIELCFRHNNYVHT